MWYFPRWILCYEYSLCDYWHSDILGLYKTSSYQVAGSASEGLEGCRVNLMGVQEGSIGLYISRSDR